MARRGPAPKPTAFKIMNGNPGKRPLNTKEPKPPTGAPTCPSHLNKEAKAEWKRVCGELQSMGLLTVVDRAALACHCQSWARHVDAEKRRDESGDYCDGAHGGQAIAPWVKVSESSMKICKSFLIEFGLTPSSRTRLNVEGQSDDQDDIDGFLSQRKRG